MTDRTKQIFRAGLLAMTVLLAASAQAQQATCGNGHSAANIYRYMFGDTDFDRYGLTFDGNTGQRFCQGPHGMIDCGCLDQSHQKETLSNEAPNYESRDHNGR